MRQCPTVEVDRRISRKTSPSAEPTYLHRRSPITQRLNHKLSPPLPKAQHSSQQSLTRPDFLYSSVRIKRSDPTNHTAQSPSRSEFSEETVLWRSSRSAQAMYVVVIVVAVAVVVVRKGQQISKRDSRQTGEGSPDWPFKRRAALKLRRLRDTKLSRFRRGGGTLSSR